MKPNVLMLCYLYLLKFTLVFNSFHKSFSFIWINIFNNTSCKVNSINIVSIRFLIKFPWKIEKLKLIKLFNKFKTKRNIFFKCIMFGIFKQTICYLLYLFIEFLFCRFKLSWLKNQALFDIFVEITHHIIFENLINIKFYII